MLQHILFDLGIGGITQERGYIEVFQREVNIDIFAVDLSLGKCNNRFYMVALVVGM